MSQIQKSEVSISLRAYLDTDEQLMIKLLSGGKGSLIGEPGLFSSNRWSKFRKTISAEKIVLAEKNLKTYEMGYVGIRNYNIVARRAELVMFCLTPDSSRSIPDRKTLDVVLDWAFNILGLNKLTIEVIDSNQILSTLESVGFLSEGTRSNYYFNGSEILDCTVMGLLAGGRTR